MIEKRNLSVYFASLVLQQKLDRHEEGLKPDNKRPTKNNSISIYLQLGHVLEQKRMIIFNITHEQLVIYQSVASP